MVCLFVLTLCTVRGDGNAFIDFAVERARVPSRERRQQQKNWTTHNSECLENWINREIRDDDDRRENDRLSTHIDKRKQDDESIFFCLPIV